MAGGDGPGFGATAAAVDDLVAGVTGDERARPDGESGSWVRHSSGGGSMKSGAYTADAAYRRWWMLRWQGSQSVTRLSGQPEPPSRAGTTWCTVSRSVLEHCGALVAVTVKDAGASWWRHPR